MLEQNDMLGMLDLLTAPGFCVKDNQIIRINAAAAGLLLEEGMDILPLLDAGKDAYMPIDNGCLFLSVTHLGKSWNASVTHCTAGDIFVLEEPEPPELQALALAARELRGPLNTAMLMTDKLLDANAPELTDPLSRLNRGLYQLLRIVGNMSDAGTQSSASQSLHEMGTVINEISQKITLLAEAAGMQLHYTGLTEPVYSLCDPRQLERALMNLLSNAIKFSPTGSTITLSLSLSGSQLRLSMEDPGCGICDELLRTIFYRYLRQPAIEDSRFGLGLGLPLVRTTARQHGGTVLIDQPEGTGTRVTLTLAIRREEPMLRQPVLLPLSGGYDSGLIELSDVLPVGMYDGTK